MQHLPIASSYESVAGPRSQKKDSASLRVRERLTTVVCSPALADGSLRLQSALRPKRQGRRRLFLAAPRREACARPRTARIRRRSERDETTSDLWRRTRGWRVYRRRGRPIVPTRKTRGRNSCAGTADFLVRRCGCKTGGRRLTGSQR